MVEVLMSAVVGELSPRDGQSERQTVWWGLFYGTERNGMERNNGLNHGTEHFLKLKL